MLVDRGGANPSSDEYVLCGSLWLYILIITRTYSKCDILLDEIQTDVGGNSASEDLLPINKYRSRIVEDLNEYIIGLILPNECMN